MGLSCAPAWLYFLVDNNNFRTHTTHHTRTYLYIVYTGGRAGDGTFIIISRWRDLRVQCKTDVCATYRKIYHTTCGKLQFQLSGRCTNIILWRFYLISSSRLRGGWCCNERLFALIRYTIYIYIYIHTLACAGIDSRRPFDISIQ